MSEPVGVRAHFQPIVDLQLMHVVGFEALARFDDGVSPLEHLRAAEQRGERGQLELLLIEIAVAAASSLPVSGFVTLNASGQTMTDPLLADVLHRGERSWGLELFEGSAPEDCDAVREQVDRLGGFLLVDDAGAGYADEKRIRRLRPDIVKIDRLLFWQALTEKSAAKQFTRLSESARSIGARVLVEGVEDDSQFAAVREMGADLAQGYHLGKPTPVDEMTRMLDDLQRRVHVDAARL